MATSTQPPSAGAVQVLMKNDSPPSALRLRPFMMPPSAAAESDMPGECATIASGCTLSTSPPASAQRAMALDGL